MRESHCRRTLSGTWHMWVYVQCRRCLDSGDSWRWDTLAMSSPGSSISLMQPTLAKAWSMYLVKTQTCLSYWYVGCIERRRSARCRWIGGIWQCWVTLSAVAWHAHLQQLRQHDFISIRQSQDQCAKHLVHWRFPRIMHGGKWTQRRWIQWRRQKPVFIALYGQPLGTSMESAHYTLSNKKKKSPKVKTLPPTSTNLFLYMLRANL